MRSVIGLAVWLVIWSGEGHAQTPSPADEAFEAGRTLSDAGSYAEACAAFELSQRFDPQLGTQFNLAGCYVRIDRIATAWRLYRELSRGDTNAQRRARATELAKELEPHISRILVRVSVDPRPWGLRVFVGKAEVTSALNAAIPFDSGYYVIEGFLPGYRPFRQVVRLGSAETRVVDVQFARAPGAGAAASGAR